MLQSQSKYQNDTKKCLEAANVPTAAEDPSDRNKMRQVSMKSQRIMGSRCAIVAKSELTT